MATETKTPKGTSYRPDMEAQQQLDKNTSKFSTFENHFIEPNKFEDGQKQWFRLIGWGSEVRAKLGQIAYIPVRKYGFGHPCRKSKKDATKREWFSHTAEITLNPSGGDVVLDYLKEVWEENGDRKAGLVKPFYNQYNTDVVDKVNKTFRTEYWVLAMPVQKDLEKEEGGKTYFSVPQGDKPMLINMPYSVYTALFGSSDKPGLLQDSEIGYSLYDKDDGIDFSITYFKTARKYEVGIRHRNPISTLDFEDCYVEENHPPVIKLIQDGIKTEECLKLLRIYAGEETCDDGEAIDEDVNDSAETTPVRKETPTEQTPASAPVRKRTVIKT